MLCRFLIVLYDNSFTFPPKIPPDSTNMFFQQQVFLSFFLVQKEYDDFKRVKSVPFFELPVDLLLAANIAVYVIKYFFNKISLKKFSSINQI